MVSARRALTHAKTDVSSPARRSSDLRIREAEKAMIEARARIEEQFYVTSFDSPYLEPEPPFLEMEPGKGGGERKSDSNRRQLRPSSRPRV